MSLFIQRPRAVRATRMVLRAMVCGAILPLPACWIPNLRPSETAPAVPETYNNAPATTENSVGLRIEDFFNDPILTKLIYDALAGNQDLKILAENIRIAENEILLRRGAYLPFMSFRAGVGTDRPSAYTREGAIDRDLRIIPGKENPNPLPDFLLAADVTWQVDIWRKLRNARDAAIYRYLATAEGRNYVVTRLIAEIADNYYTLLALDKRLETLNEIIALQEKSLLLARAKKDAARGTELAVQRFQAEVQKNQSEKLIVQQDIIEAENRINFLAGRFPQKVERRTVEFFDLNFAPLNVGVPSQLLLNRPDIRQAEQELQAAGLEVLVARAEFLPSLDITAGLGYRAFNPQYLFNPEAFMANAAGGLVAPVINRRAIAAAYKTANARQLQAVYDYQRTVINAFTEVMNQMSAADNYGKSLVLRKQQLDSLEASIQTATRLFENARAEYIEVLFAQRDYLDAKTAMIETKRQQLTAVVYTYQALGGGSNTLPFFDPAGRRNCPPVSPRPLSMFPWYTWITRTPPTPASFVGPVATATPVAVPAMAPMAAPGMGPMAAPLPIPVAPAEPAPAPAVKPAPALEPKPAAGPAPAVVPPGPGATPKNK